MPFQHFIFSPQTRPIEIMSQVQNEVTAKRMYLLCTNKICLVEFFSKEVYPESTWILLDIDLSYFLYFYLPLNNYVIFCCQQKVIGNSRQKHSLYRPEQFAILYILNSSDDVKIHMQLFHICRFKRLVLELFHLWTVAFSKTRLKPLDTLEDHHYTSKLI